MGGTLIVDEAFIDATPDDSLTPLYRRRGSAQSHRAAPAGQVFRLAARLGFMFANAELRDRVRRRWGHGSSPPGARGGAPGAFR